MNQAATSWPSALAIPERAADEIVFDVLAGYLQSQAMRRPPDPLLGERRR